MPIIRNEEPLTQTQQKLVDELTNEINSGATGRTSPTIIEDRSPFTSNVGVTVIWDRWKDVPQNKRGRIIMDAYMNGGRTSPTHTNPVGISLAMGLTSAEAAKLGIRY